MLKCHKQVIIRCYLRSPVVIHIFSATADEDKTIASPLNSTSGDTMTFVVGLIAIVWLMCFIAGWIGISAMRTDLLLVRPTNCNPNYYENYTDWYIGDYWLVPDVGACPTKVIQSIEILIASKCIF